MIWIRTIRSNYSFVIYFGMCAYDTDMANQMSTSGMALVREWRNVEKCRIERLYEGPNGTHVLVTAAYDPESPDLVFVGEDAKGMSPMEVGNWYAIASGDVQRTGPNQSFKDSPNN